MSTVDLHLHTTASDGRHTPAEIVRKSAALGMTVIAITDHDTVDGIAAALEEAKQFPRLTVIPGVELSTDVPQGEVHILGYFIDHTDVLFRGRLEQMRVSRVTRARKMVEKLAALGLPVSWERVRQLTGGGTIGRPHIAQALLEKGYLTSIQSAFDKYLGHGKPAYVSRDKLTPAEAVQMVTGAKGLPVLAHPLTVANPEQLVIELKAAGLLGMEVYYAGYSDEEINPLLGMAQKYGLLATGGTDYHGIAESAETMIGGVEVPPQTVARLLALANARGMTTGLSERRHR